MEVSEIIGIGGFIVAIVSLVTGFMLQRDQKKIRELERDNKKYRDRLKKALQAIEGYQLIEVENAKLEGIDVSLCRKNIRSGNQNKFNTKFLTPKRISEMIEDIENE